MPSLPCPTEGCKGLIEMQIAALHDAKERYEDVKLWSCKTCHRSYTNEEIRELFLGDPEALEGPFDAWKDEQKRVALLCQGHFKGHSTKSKRFGKKKMGQLRKDLWGF